MLILSSVLIGGANRTDEVCSQISVEAVKILTAPCKIALVKVNKPHVIFFINITCPDIFLSTIKDWVYVQDATLLAWFQQRSGFFQSRQSPIAKSGISVPFNFLTHSSAFCQVIPRPVEPDWCHIRPVKLSITTLPPSIVFNL